jgi:hypothetical protein
MGLEGFALLSERVGIAFLVVMNDHEQIFRRLADRREQFTQRRREIARQIETLRAEDAQLAQRDLDIQTAEREIAALLADSPPVQITALGDLAASLVSGLEPAKKRQQRKPDHLPPILQMTDEALANFEEAGNAWATARDIAKFIRANYWPEAKAEFIQGQLWRAAERGDLLKRGSCYARKSARNEEGSDTVVAEPLQNGAAVRAA